MSDYPTEWALYYGAHLFFSYIDHLVVGIWLYAQTKHIEAFRTYIWVLLGFGAGLIAALIFIVLVIFETQQPEKDV